MESKYLQENKKNTIEKKLYCNNCGKIGHYSKNCREPITSLGIISFKIEKTNIYNNIIQKFTEPFVDIKKKY